MIAPGAPVLVGASEDTLQMAAASLEPVADKIVRRTPGELINRERPPSPISTALDDPSNEERQVNIMARVLHDYESQEVNEISIKKGEFVLIKEKQDGNNSGEEWCYGFVLNKPTNQFGNFPKKYVEEIDENTMIMVDDPELVPEGFHENCRDENGAVKITKENYHLYRDVGHLIQMYEQEDWAQKEGVTYTKEMSKCPDGRLPTLESLMSLQLSGYKLHGRIIMTKNNVFDADTQNKLARLTEQDVQVLMMDYQKKNLWRKSNSAEDITQFSLSKDVDGIMDDGSHMKMTKGVYIKKNLAYSKSEENISKFCLCDEPTCCLMNMTMLNIFATPMLPREFKDEVMDFFKTREIFQKDDEVNGNAEICHYCLDQGFNYIFNE